MHKLFQSRHGYLIYNLKCCLVNPKFLLPFSHFHNFSKTQGPDSTLDFGFNEVVEAVHPSEPTNQTTQRSSKTSESTGGSELKFQIKHPWPEWVDLMELLLKKGYFEVNGNPFLIGELGTKETNFMRTACLNFARDRFELMRLLSRKDIHVIAGCGCPNTDRKVVNSAKRLRAYVGVGEGNVCSSCNLRGNCERAYANAREDEGGRTVDVMRIVLTHGLGSISSTIENKGCQNKIVKESVRRLLKEILQYSSQQPDSDCANGSHFGRGAREQDGSSPQEKDDINVPMKRGDWLCPKCNFLNFARNIKCLRCDGLFEGRLKKLHEDQENLPLKKGDWICEKCNFLNFAKNTRCLRCKENPPKRQLHPGEWECESCNYINFRRNMECLKCDHKRPKASNASKTSAQLECKNGDYSNDNGLGFLHGENKTNDLESVGPDRMNQNRGANMWRFVEEEREDNHLISRNEDSIFVDLFPIAGGKSSLSQNAEKRERWKEEMQDRSKSGARIKENKEEFGDANTQTRMKYLEPSDDEDMADWFGKGESGSNKL